MRRHGHMILGCSMVLLAIASCSKHDTSRTPETALAPAAIADHDAITSYNARLELEADTLKAAAGFEHFDVSRAKQTAEFIMPEVILTLFGCIALVLDVMLPRARKRVVGMVSLAGVGFSLVSMGLLYNKVSGTETPKTAFFDMIVVDNYAVVFKLIFLVGAGLSILLSLRYLDAENEQRGEYYSLILFSVVGMMFMASGVDLLTLFISLELMAISVYILVGFLKRDQKSNEASMKYFLLGAFSSGVLLFGISLIYGLTGTTNLAGIDSSIHGRRANR